jgi:hypothetical protein
MAPIRYSNRPMLAREQTVKSYRSNPQRRAVQARKHAPRLTLLFFAILCGTQAVPETKAEGPQNERLGAPCAHPGETSTGFTYNPATQKWNILQFVCAYSDQGAGWRWALTQPYNQ